MNEKCRMQNGKIKMKVYEIMAYGHTPIF